MLFDANKLQLKIIDKFTHEYIGEVMLMNLDTEIPGLGIQLLREYHNQGIGTRIINLFVNKLKTVLSVDIISIRISSDNQISQKMFEKMGAVKIGEEGKEYAELMQRFMQGVGRENFKEIVKEDFEKT